MCGYTEESIAAKIVEAEAEQARRDELVARYRKHAPDGVDKAGLVITYEVIEQHRKAMHELVDEAMNAGDPVNVIAISEANDGTIRNVGTMQTKQHFAALLAVAAATEPAVNGVVLN
jgi:hypothetical protein